MSWNFEAKDKDVYLLVGGSRARTRRGEELGRIVSIEPGNHSDQLKVHTLIFCLINTCKCIYSEPSETPQGVALPSCIIKLEV